MEEAQRYTDLTDRMIFLRAIPVGAELSTAVLKVLAGYMRERTFESGELLMTQGKPIVGLHMLLEGKVTLIREDTPFGAIAAPQTLGFLGILAGGEGTYDARADGTVIALEIETEALQEVIEDHSEFLRATLRYLSQRMLYEVQELPPEMLQSRLTGEDAVLPERDLNLVERILYLRTLRAFTQSNLNALATMADRLTEVRFADGDKIWAEGDRADISLIVTAGKTRCERGDDEWSAGPTSVVGGMESIGGQPRWYDLYASGRLRGFSMPTDSFLDLLEDDFDLATDFIQVLANEMIGLLARRAASGKSSVTVKRDVSKLGKVLVGA